jgi:hypothetical protein
MEVSHEEHARMISQSVISKPTGRGGRRKPALVFTEHGAIMAATILRSARAVAMSVYVVRAFVRMREELMTGAVILKRLAEIDRTLLEHDAALRTLWSRLRPLLVTVPKPPPRELGFHVGIRRLKTRR